MLNSNQLRIYLSVSAEYLEHDARSDVVEEAPRIYAGELLGALARIHGRLDCIPSDLEAAAGIRALSRKCARVCETAKRAIRCSGKSGDERAAEAAPELRREALAFHAELVEALKAWEAATE